MQSTSAAATSSKLNAVIVPPQGGTWVSWLGSPIQYLATGVQTNESFCAMSGELAPQAGSPPHRHKFHEGFYVLEGEVAFYAGKERVLLKKGDFINIAGGTVHRLCNESDSAAKLLVITAPAGFDRFQLEAGEVISGPGKQGAKRVEEIVAQMRKDAPRYGIELDPPESAYDETPRFTVRRAGEGQTFAVVGDLYTFLVDGSDTDQTYAIWHAVVSPGGGPPPHLHQREEEGFYVLSGEVTFYADGQRHTGVPGTFVTLPRNGLHRFANEGAKPAEMLILVAPAGLERMFYETGIPWSDRSKSVPPPSQEEITRLIGAVSRFGVELQLPPH